MNVEELRICWSITRADGESDETIVIGSQYLRTFLNAWVDGKVLR